jgi:dTDP-4-amino-4,6-dideoxygalactose transaminase
MNVPFVDLREQYLSIKPEIDDVIQNALLNSSFIGGQLVKDFESNFSKLYGTKNCIGVGNGTDSLYIIMKMLGIGPGDEVITAANSWISSSETITQTGASVVFVDVDPIYYTMCPDDLKRKITKKTKAIIPVHLYGQMCDMDEILKISSEFGIKIVEDCAQSHFSKYNNQNAGNFGDAASFSFYPGKNLGAYGDAGCIITNNDELAITCRMYAHHGSLVKHQHQIEGINSRLDSIQAGILNVKLKHILNWTNLRQVKASYYSEKLTGIGDIVTPKIRDNSEHTFHVYAILTNHRDALLKFLNSEGVSTAVHYPKPLPFLNAYNYLNHQKEDFPVAHDLSYKLLSLPIYPEITIEQQNYVINKINQFFNSK